MLRVCLTLVKYKYVILLHYRYNRHKEQRITCSVTYTEYIQDLHQYRLYTIDCNLY